MSNARSHNAYFDTPESKAELQRITSDLRTPLTVVIGFCELLQDEGTVDATTMRDFAARIAANAWRLNTAVERLISELNFAASSAHTATDGTGPSGTPSLTEPLPRVSGGVDNVASDLA